MHMHMHMHTCICTCEPMYMPRMSAHAARLGACGALAVGKAGGSAHAQRHASQAGSCGVCMHTPMARCLPSSTAPESDPATATARRRGVDAASATLTSAMCQPRRLVGSSRRVNVDLLGMEARRLVDSASDPRGSDSRFRLCQDRAQSVGHVLGRSASPATRSSMRRAGLVVVVGTCW